MKESERMKEIPAGVFSAKGEIPFPTHYSFIKISQ